MSFRPRLAHGSISSLHQRQLRRLCSLLPVCVGVMWAVIAMVMDGSRMDRGGQMKTMNMPGFSAEIATYVSISSYRSEATGIGTRFGTIMPAHSDCISGFTCTPCIPKGPSIFSPGEQFCYYTLCSPTAFGGCRCSTFFKGKVSCKPGVPDVLLGS